MSVAFLAGIFTHTSIILDLVDIHLIKFEYFFNFFFLSIFFLSLAPFEYFSATSKEVPLLASIRSKCRCSENGENSSLYFTFFDHNESNNNLPNAILFRNTRRIALLLRAVRSFSYLDDKSELGNIRIYFPDILYPLCSFLLAVPQKRCLFHSFLVPLRSRSECFVSFGERH